MNSTDFTLNDLKKVIPCLVKDNKGITVSTSKFNKDLIEFSSETDIIIKSAIEKGDCIETVFTQSFSLTGDEGFGELYEYETLQSIYDIKSYINLKSK